METKHTKGEWEAEPFKKGVSNGWININYPNGVITAYGKDIDTNTPDELLIKEAEANAKLIAAAPDLLEACIGLLELLAFHGYLNATEIFKANAAIEKATK